MHLSTELASSEATMECGHIMCFFSPSGIVPQLNVRVRHPSLGAGLYLPRYAFSHHLQTPQWFERDDSHTTSEETPRISDCLLGSERWDAEN